MGCSTSRSNEENNDEEDNYRLSENQMNFMTSSLRKLLMSKDPVDLLKAFVKLDKTILEEENRSPSSLFGQGMSRQQQIKAHLQSAIEVKNQNEILSEDCSIHDLFVDLGLSKDPQSAAEHEEFVASINRRAINQNSIEILERNLKSVEEQIKQASERISELQSAYQQQDELLGQIFGETYGSDTEKELEKELDTTRYYRDILSIGVLQWEVSATNVLKAVELLQKGVSSWKSLRNQSLDKQINLAAEARNCIQEAMLLVQMSEELLQDVQFPYCTARELRGVSQATDYVFTDVLIEDRYLHASEVYDNFLERAGLLYEWIKQVLNSRLKKDLLEIEERVSKTARQLRNERIYLICKKLKINNPPEDLLENDIEELQTPMVKTYNERQPEMFDFDRFPINLESKLGLNQNQGEDFNVQKYFQKVVEDRKSKMWPSRRIDELQSMIVQR